MYHGEQVGWRRLGIKPTQADRDRVRALSLMGVGVRELCVRLGERYGLEKPMSRLTLYYHFREDLIGKRLGRPPHRGTIKRNIETNMRAEMRRLIEEAKARAGKA